MTHSRRATRDQPTPGQGGARRVLLVLPYEMSSRMVVGTPLAAALAQRRTLQVTMVSRQPEDACRLAALPGSPPAWRPFLRPFRRSGDSPVPASPRLSRFLGDIRFALGVALHLSLVYRFNCRAGFRGFRDRLQQSAANRRRAFREGLPTLRLLGFPFPRNARLFGLLYRLLYARWQRHPAVERLFDDQRPDLLVLTHLQSGLVTPYVLAARARGIAILGLNGSWDQPTTKGPLVPGPRRILVQGGQVKADLMLHHGVAARRIEVVGWPQMDIYCRQDWRSGRSAFLARLCLPATGRYILVGAYSERLGAHEPEMCQRLLHWLAARPAGSPITLYIRCHPLDRQWRSRLYALHDPPRAVVEPPDAGRLDHLAALIAHAEVVISSAGTIALDAAALDAPAIAVAFEDERLPYYDRAARRYDMEHYRAVVETGGLRVVHSQAELEDAISLALLDRGLDADGRRRLRESHLAPLDGQACGRIADAIAAAAETAAVEPPS